MKKYRVAVVGCGRMGWLFDEDKLVKKPLSHLKAYSLNPRTEVGCVCDKNKKLLDAASARYGVRNAYGDYRKMFEKEELDIVSICTPAALHKEICIAAARSGVKAVFCEKPIAPSLGDADAMIRACRDNGVFLAVNHTRRWDASFEGVKKVLKEKMIGDITLVVAFATAGLLNSGTHLFDLLRQFFGDAESVSGSLIPDASADPGGRGIIRFKNGIFCFFDSCFRDYLLFGLDIYGEKGVLEAGKELRSKEAFKLFLGKKSEKEYGIKELMPLGRKAREWPSPIENAVKNIAAALDKKEDILCTGEDGRAALEMALSFHESHRRGGKDVKLPLMNMKLTVIPRQTSFARDGRAR